VLAQIDNPAYIKFYEELDERNYIILDNGLAEDQMVSNEKLFQRAMHYRADEIVLPDVMEDAQATLDRSADFLAEFHTEDFKFMGVLQSQGDIGSIHRCIEGFAKMPKVTALGVPRHLVDKDLFMRLQVCQLLSDDYNRDRFEVHLLGTNSKKPHEIKGVANSYPWVRSCDTSMPYNYTMAGLDLSEAHTQINRPPDYFDVRRTLNADLLYKNIDTYKRWARGESTWS
jgi:hypothetical protein